MCVQFGRTKIVRPLIGVDMQPLIAVHVQPLLDERHCNNFLKNSENARGKWLQHDEAASYDRNRKYQLYDLQPLLAKY